MTSPVGINAESVGAWLESNVDGATGPFTYDLITGGHSNITFKVTDSNGTEMVLRRPPLGAVLATAHDMGREHKIISAVGKSSVPVPRTLGMCTDESVNEAPFYIMEYVEGLVAHDSSAMEQGMPDMALRAATSEDVVQVIAALHMVNPDDVGLGDLGRKEAYLDRQLKRWSGQWEKSKTRELPDMDWVYNQLVERKPEQRYTGIVHGDYRLGNMLVNPADGSVAAVLDWELCTLGDVLADIGYLLNNWVQPGEDSSSGATAFATTVGGFSTREELVDRYCEITGFEVGDINYYRAFQNWRLAAIVEGVLSRYLQGVMADSSADTDVFRNQVDGLCAQAVALLS